MVMCIVQSIKKTTAGRKVTYSRNTGRNTGQKFRIYRTNNPQSSAFHIVWSTPTQALNCQKLASGVDGEAQRAESGGGVLVPSSPARGSGKRFKLKGLRAFWKCQTASSVVMSEKYRKYGTFSPTYRNLQDNQKIPEVQNTLYTLQLMLKQHDLTWLIMILIGHVTTL